MRDLNGLRRVSGWPRNVPTSTKWNDGVIVVMRFYGCQRAGAGERVACADKGCGAIIEEIGKSDCRIVR